MCKKSQCLSRSSFRPMLVERCHLSIQLKIVFCLLPPKPCVATVRQFRNSPRRKLLASDPSALPPTSAMADRSDAGVLDALLQRLAASQSANRSQGEREGLVSAALSACAISYYRLRRALLLTCTASHPEVHTLPFPTTQILFPAPS